MRREVLILGLGHIGASLGARLSRSGRWRVLGWDRDGKAVRYCGARGWVGLISDRSPKSGDRRRQVQTRMVCVVALPESAVMEPASERALCRVLDTLPRGSVVSDVFSSKGEATARLARLCRARGLVFAWSHPLAGREGSGVASADPAIFVGARVLLQEDAPERARRALALLWRDAGGRPALATTSEHQKAMGWGSHLAHAVAFSLARVVAGRGRMSPSVASATRVARSNPRAWAEILISNRTELARAIAALRKELARVEALLAARDASGLRRYLGRSKPRLAVSLRNYPPIWAKRKSS